MSRGTAIRLSVATGDVLQFPVDVLALKHAQALHGVDRHAVGLLHQNGDVRIFEKLPEIGESLLTPSRGAMAPARILFVGVKPLGRFDYAEIRKFGDQVLAILSQTLPETRDVTLTLHGRGFGLDEAEAFKAEIAGLLDAIRANTIPRALESVTVVEQDEGTAERLTAILKAILPTGTIAAGAPRRRTRAIAAANDALDTVGAHSKAKPHIFVAMPFAPEFDDRFHYGISNAVNAAGYLCERADLASFSGDVIAWVRERIDQAALVIADLSTANPNVYLEVGYAWGRGVRTVLLAPSESDLRFDVRGQRCLVFKSIRHLEEILTKELAVLTRN